MKLKGRWNYALIAAFFAILGLSEACSASSVSSHSKAHPRRHSAGLWRGKHESRVVSLRGDLLLSTKQVCSHKNDWIEVPDDSEDDEGDEPREALSEGGPDVTVFHLDCLGAPLWADAIPRLRTREGGSPWRDRPRFLSLCRWLI